jgi:hypothetical protein
MYKKQHDARWCTENGRHPRPGHGETGTVGDRLCFCLWCVVVAQRPARAKRKSKNVRGAAIRAKNDTITNDSVELRDRDTAVAQARVEQSQRTQRSTLGLRSEHSALSGREPWRTTRLFFSVSDLSIKVDLIPGLAGAVDGVLGLLLGLPPHPLRSAAWPQSAALRKQRALHRCLA